MMHIFKFFCALDDLTWGSVGLKDLHCGAESGIFCYGHPISLSLSVWATFCQEVWVPVVVGSCIEVILVGCLRVGSVGEHAGGIAKADDSNGFRPSCEGRQTPGRYVDTFCGALVPSMLVLREPSL